MITLNILKTDPKYREMNQVQLANLILWESHEDSDDETSPYFNLPGLISDDKAEHLIEWFKQNPLPEKVTVIKAVESSFSELPPEFHLLDLIAKTRQKTGRPYLTDGTITRRLRELREYTRINFKVIDTHKSIYQKLEVTKTQ